MGYNLTGILAAAALAFAGAPAIAADTPNDAQIAHIAYTAGNLDVVAAKQALQKSKSAAVREFASAMVRDHEAVNAKALELVKALKVTPEDNSTSQSLSKAADETMKKLAALDGAEFDKAYVANEVAFHRAVNGALESTLIPSASNAQLKSLLETGLTLFREHQLHAEHLAADLK
jgi:putative membrane protein